MSTAATKNFGEDFEFLLQNFDGFERSGFFGM